MSQQFNDGSLSQYSEDMTAYTLEQVVQWRAALERKAKEQEERERSAKANSQPQGNAHSKS
ncbi:hypothetical protein AZE42_12876 [Rhizopogon vesiculosus]|uniref:Uncharacterized protein n=1 Tax=Rhizopogon vesiculosus TaxID=180088 RepID=A0A1J8QZ59_9AGAM|nr:hypothetical protein AZE42_12876 [Rhizopogon vesiculosus]